MRRSSGGISITKLRCLFSYHGKYSGLNTRHFSSEKVDHYDVVFLGGGVMASSSAYFTALRQPRLRIGVIERDPTYTNCSTSLSVGSIRQQFSTPENIQLSQFGFKFLSNIDKHLTVDENDPVDINLRNGRYLILASEQGIDTMKEHHQIQRQLDCKVKLLSPKELTEMYPAFNADDIQMASIGTANEGWFDPWALLSSFRKKAISLGVEYIDNTQVTNVTLDKGLVSSIEISPRDSPSQRSVIHCGLAVNTTGCWSGQTAAMMGIDLPIEPRKRYVFVLDCPGLVLDDALVVLPRSGVWFRREGKHFIAGRCPPPENEPRTDDLEVDYDYFDEFIWQHLAHYVPAFECIKIVGAWAGYYDYNIMDQNAVVGYHPDISNLIFASGFSGHGIQHSPGIGRAVSELILDQRYTTLDLSKLGYDRIIQNQLLLEKNII